MDQKIDNHLKNFNVEGDYVGGNQTNNYYTMFQDTEREFVVTHNVNIKPVSYFIGRETELQELRQRIEEGRKSVLVSGMGGIGKTHICRKLFEEYLNRHAEGEDEPFCHIGYIQYTGDMGASLLNCLKYKQQDDLEQNHEAAWRELEYLAADGKLLLFVDNVNVPIGEDAGLGRLRNIPGAVILTSRRTSFSKEFEPYRIGFLDKEQCKKVYESIRYDGNDMEVPEEEMPDLEYIIDTLAARHTITIEFLAHLAWTKQWTVQELWDKLEESGFQLEYMDEEDKLVNIQKSYEILYDMSELTEAEQNILEAFSVFPYIPLEAETCNEWLLLDAGVSEDDDILIGLYQKGWLQFDIEQETYVLHPVFAQFIYEKCKPKIENHMGLVKGCMWNLNILEGDSVLECQKIVLFAESMLEKVDMRESVGQIQFSKSLGNVLYKMAEYEKSKELYIKVLRLNKQMFGEKHLDTSICYNNLALVYAAQGEYEKAEELYIKSMLINKKILSKKDPATVSVYNNLAALYADQGKYGKAEELYIKSLRISEKMLGEVHPQTAIYYNNLAALYADQGEYEKAKELYVKSIWIYKKVFGEAHPNIGTSYHNLASLYQEQEEYEKAEELYIKSLQIREKMIGEEHPDTAVTYNDLAGIYLKQEKYKSALEYLLKSYKILEFKLGLNHQNTQIVYENMKIAYCEWNPEGNFEQWLDEKMKEEDGK